MTLGWRWAALKNGFQDATVYRTEFLFEVLGSAFVPAAVQWILWYALFKVGGMTSVAGMTYHDMILYTMVSLLFTQIRGGDNDFEIQEMIRNGSLSQYLLKPLSVVEFVYIRGVAQKILLAGICLFLGITIGAVFGLNPFRIVGAMFLAIVGNIIHYQMGVVLSTTAFYWEEAYSILMVKNMIVGILSGEVIPLNLFPENMQWIWKSTPFYLYVFGPVQFATGKWSVQEFSVNLFISFGWVLLCWFLIKIFWGLGIKKYLSIGG